MVYIDFDGVILDTEPLLFKEWRKIPNRHSLSEEVKIRYIQSADWNYIVNHSEIINHSVQLLKEMDSNETSILTKIHSLKEGKAKIEWLRRNKIRQSAILVPYTLKKTDMVDANDNILIDDCLKNLCDWEKRNGKPIFFDIDNDNYDSWHQLNTYGYQKIMSLSKYR